MSSAPLAGLRLVCEEQAETTIIHCEGKITAENADAFQSEVRSLLPMSRGHVDNVTCRIVLDLANVAYVDSTGLGSLVAIWTAAQRRSCDLEIANLNPRVEKLVELTKLDSIFGKIKRMFGKTA